MFPATTSLDADLRAQPHLQLFATEASPSGAGACSTPVSRELWTLLYDFSDEKKVPSEVGLGNEFEAPTGTSRFASSGGRIGGGFVVGFRYPQHINPLELEAFISLIRGLVDRGLKSSCALFG